MGKYWSRLSHQSQLWFVLLALCIIPLIVLGVVAYMISVNSLEKQVDNDLKVISTQLNSMIEKQITDFDRLSTLPYFSPEIIELLGQPYVPWESWGVEELNTRDKFRNLVVTYPFLNNMIEGLVIYGLNGTMFGYRASEISSIDQDFRPVDEPWYKEALAAQGGLVVTGLRQERQFVGEPFPVITVARVLVNKHYEPAAIIAIHISPEFIGKLVRSLLFQNALVTVANKDGETIYSTHPDISEPLLAAYKPTPGADDTAADSHVVSANAQGAVGSWRGVRNYSEYLGWNTYLLVDRDELLRENKVIQNLTVAAVIVFSITITLISWLLARRLSKPIRQLIRSMRDVERGKFEVPVIETREDEIGRLYHSYSQMVRRLNDLIRSIEEKERLKRESEMYALRARINPHFLYNTLNSIRMLAILQKLPQIEKLLQALSQLLKANMRLDSQLVRVSEELDLLRQYLHLMDLRYTNMFEVNWSVDPEAQQAWVLPMIVQPVVENAIFHGASGIEGKLRIEIAVYAGDKGQLIIEVGDNGKGMPPETVQKLLTASESADQPNKIGIRNVHERIRLRFGDSYGLAIESDQNGRGTKVIYRLPYMREKE